MPVQIICKSHKDPTKTITAMQRQILFFFFRHSSSSNAEVNILIWPEFELEILWLSWVPASSKKSQSKVKALSSEQHFLHYKYMEKIFRHSSVTPKGIFRSGPKSNLSEILWLASLPASLMKI